ncbi:MAG: WecB/TagA/CpsF family glycosyltransferase [Treponema sp.]|nr:WecB/TagA/CpsF family glycosyltransferase [Treponema sp.]
MGDEVAGGLAGADDKGPAESKNPDCAEDQTSERVSFLKVPVDIVMPDQLGRLAFRLLAQGTERNIVLLSVWDLLRARRNAEYRSFVNQAALVIPVSSSIIRGIRFLLGKQAVRYMPFDFVIALLSMLESYELSAYLLGGKKRILIKAEKNIRETFPGLRVVGRFSGSFRRQDEPVILEAIRKASPSLLLVGQGVRGGEHWIARNSGRLGKGLRLWCSDLFDVFAEKKKHPSRMSFDLGLDWVGYCLHNPFKLLRFFPLMHYNSLLLAYRFFKKKDPAA